MRIVIWSKILFLQPYSFLNVTKHKTTRKPLFAIENEGIVVSNVLLVNKKKLTRLSVKL